jgi:WD40 repeat protein
MITGLQYCQSRNWIVSGSADGFVRIWDDRQAADSIVLDIKLENDSRVIDLDCQREQIMIALNDMRTTTIDLRRPANYRDAASVKKSLEFYTSPPEVRDYGCSYTSLAVSRDGSYYMAGTVGGFVECGRVDRSYGMSPKTIGCFGGRLASAGAVDVYSINAVAFAPEQSGDIWGVAVGGDGRLWVIDVEEGKLANDPIDVCAGVPLTAVALMLDGSGDCICALGDDWHTGRPVSPSPVKVVSGKVNRGGKTTASGGAFGGFGQARRT